MQNRQLIIRLLAFGGTAALIVLAGGAGIQAQQPAAVEGAAFLKQYCVTCHNQKLKTGGLTLDTIDLRDVSGNGELLEKIVLKVGSGAMPPASARRCATSIATTIRPRAASALPASRDKITTLAPSCTNSLAMASPMPIDPPVTTATLPTSAAASFAMLGL